MAANMMRHRSAAAMAVFDGQIYALGGHDGLSIFDSVRNLATSNMALHGNRGGEVTSTSNITLHDGSGGVTVLDR